MVSCWDTGVLLCALLGGLLLTDKYLEVELLDHMIARTPLQYSCLENPMDGGA